MTPHSLPFTSLPHKIQLRGPRSWFGPRSRRRRSRMARYSPGSPTWSTGLTLSSPSPAETACWQELINRPPHICTGLPHGWWVFLLEPRWCWAWLDFMASLPMRWARGRAKSACGWRLARNAAAFMPLF